MRALIAKMLSRLVREPRIDVVFADGSLYSAGQGAVPAVKLRIADRETEFRLALDPELALGEAVMDGRIIVERGTIYQLLETLVCGLSRQPPSAWAGTLGRLRTAVRRLKQHNTPAWAKSNVHHHYDLKSEFFRLFLDADRQYSCAFFEHPGATLEEAQTAKKRRIAAKLALKPGQRVLDIGSGWGGLGLYLAKRFEVDVLGVTLSTEQHGVATERAQAEGLENHVHFEIKDYRNIAERFDRIISVGMFEHVGLNHYRAFFEKSAQLLKPDGVMVLHSIGRSGQPYATSAFIRKYIFPGGYIPSLSEVLPAIEKSGLVVTDIEILRLHYAETLKHWRQRFLANRDKAKAIYDERFCRMWDFYLAGSEAAFRWQDLMIFQIQLTKKNDTLPITRGYIEKTEKALAVRDKAQEPKAAKPVAKAERAVTPRKAPAKRKKA